MNKLEKISISRIISDLIKADTIIDSREMDLFKSVKSTYRLSQDCLCDARFMTFSDAVNNLAVLEETEKQELMELFKRITLADGMCNREESLLMISLLYCLEGKNEAEMLHVAVPQQGIQLETSQIIFIESEYDEQINKVISENYQQIENALRLAGFNFAYIPQIAKTYRNTPQDLFCSVMSFLTPNFNQKELLQVQDKVSVMTTAEFCKNQLCKKLHINSLYDAPPSLLLKVGETVSDNNIYANFLRFEVDTDILHEIKQFIYLFTSMMNAEYSIVRNIYNTGDRFIYSGVYKQIIDLYLMQEDTMSIVLLNPNKRKITFPKIQEELKVSRSGKALYLLILLESLTGGLNLNQPQNARQLLKHEEKMSKLMKKYSLIYQMFGGDADSIPNILDPTIRNPKISKINKQLQSLQCKLSNNDDYMVHRTAEGLYKIYLDSSMIFYMNDEMIPWMQSERLRRIVSM